MSEFSTNRWRPEGVKRECVFSNKERVPLKKVKWENEEVTLLWNIWVTLFLKGPSLSQPHLCFCLHARIWPLYLIRSLRKRRKNTVKLLKIIKHTFRNTAYRKTIRIRFTVLYINNSYGIENGRGWLGPFKLKLPVTFLRTLVSTKEDPAISKCHVSTASQPSKELRNNRLCLCKRGGGGIDWNLKNSASIFE